MATSPEMVNEWPLRNLFQFTVSRNVISRESCGGYDFGELEAGQTAASGLGRLDVIESAGEVNGHAWVPVGLLVCGRSTPLTVG
jgi:hypothetical protein